MEIFASGLERQSPLADNAPQPRSSQDQGADTAHSFITGLVHPESENEKVKQFLSLVHCYSKQKNMTLMITEQNPDHPVEKFARLFLACLLKLHDLVQLALILVDQENGVNNESPINFPSALADICKLIYDAKLTLVKSRQESSCSYEEICGPAIERCLFLIDNIRSPATNVQSILHRHQILNVESRWKTLARKALTWNRDSCKEENISPSGSVIHEETGSMKRILYERQHSRDIKSLAQAQEVSN